MLGIPPEADNNEINRAYARKKYEFRHESTNLQKVEQAHSSLMLSAFQQRVKVRERAGKEPARACGVGPMRGRGHAVLAVRAMVHGNARMAYWIKVS